MIESSRFSDAWNTRLWSLLALLAALLIVLTSASVAHGARDSHGFRGNVRNLANIINHRMIFAALPARVALDSETATAFLETIRLPAGEELQTVDLSGDGLIRFAVDTATAREALGPDGHSLASVGQEVTLTAKTVRKMLSRVVNTSGVMVARSLVNQRGVAKAIGENAKLEVTTATKPTPVFVVKLFSL